MCFTNLNDPRMRKFETKKFKLKTVNQDDDYSKSGIVNSGNTVSF